MFHINQIPLYDFFYRDVTAFHQVLLTPPCFLSRKITKNAKSHLPPMRDIIIEEPHASYFVILGLWQHLTFTTGDLL